VGVWIAVAQDPAPTVVRTPVLLRTASPEVRADRTIVFRLRAPGASKVTLQFAGLSPMTKGEAGIWTATVGPVAPEIYQYNFIVDGLRILDPGNPTLRNGWAIDASIVEVPGVRRDSMNCRQCRTAHWGFARITRLC